RTRQRRRCEVVRRERCEVARTLDAFQRSEERCAALLVAALTSARVECGVYLLGRALDHFARQDEHDPVVLGELESFEFATVARAELRSVLQEVRNVRAQRTRKRAQLRCGIGIASQRVCQPPRGRRVGAAAAQPRGNRKTFLDPRAEARAVAVDHALEGATNERIAGEPSDAQRGRAVDRDPVGERNALVDRDELVVPVLTGRTDDERQVDLGGRGCATHSRASASARNSAGASSSPRTFGSRPIVAIASSARPRSATPASSSEFARRLRLCAKQASTTCFTRRKSCGSPVRRKATSAESTFGRGRNTVGGTGWKPVRSATSCTRTDTAPYALVEGEAKRRSATSRCTITVQSSIPGRRSRLSAINGVATLYGRLATSFFAPGAASARSSFTASPKRNSTFGRPASRSTSCGPRDVSTSTAYTWATRSARYVVRMPRPGPISSTTSSSASSARRPITPRMFSSTRKFCLSLFFALTIKAVRRPQLRSRQS